MPDPAVVRRSVRLLGVGGSLSRGLVRHAPLAAAPAAGFRRPTLHVFGQPGDVAARRRAQAGGSSTSLRMLLDALRVR